MARTSKSIQHIERPGALTDAERSSTLAGIVQAAQTSQLCQSNPLIQSMITSLVKTEALIKPGADLVSQDQAKLDVDELAVNKVRSRFDNDLETLITLVETNAVDADDVKSVNMTPRGDPPPKPALLPPDSLDIRLGKKGQGWFRASAHEVGKARRRYAAEWSPDPSGANTWLSLPGSGKSRKLTGVSGAKVWVRFALELGELRSEWGTPVLVTFP